MEIEDITKILVNTATTIAFISYWDMDIIYMLQQHGFDESGLGING